MKHRRFHPPARPTTGRGRLTPRREALVYAILGVLWASGIGWLVFHYFFATSGDFGALPHPLEAWWLRLHGAAGFAALWLLGLLWVAHLVPGWKARRRPSGIALAVLLGVLVATGYCLYYVGGDDARAWIAIVHWIIGAGLPLLLAPHVLRGRSPPPPRS